MEPSYTPRENCSAVHAVSSGTRARESHNLQYFFMAKPWNAGGDLRDFTPEAAVLCPVKASGLQDELRLRDDRAQFPFSGLDRRLPHHGGPSTMQRQALADDGRIHARGPDELRA
jgi:hypothetical protein